jgi:hypothetical protein
MWMILFGLAGVGAYAEAGSLDASSMMVVGVLAALRDIVAEEAHILLWED